MEDGLLGFLNSPAGAGLLSAVAGGMAGARRGTPVNNIGRAGLAGLLGYGQAQDDVTKNKQLEESMKTQGLQRQLLEGQVSDSLRQRNQQTLIDQAARDSYSMGAPASTQFKTPLMVQDVGTSSVPTLPLIGGDIPGYNPTTNKYNLEGEARQPEAPGFKQSVFLDKMRSIDPLKAMQYEQEFKKANAPTISKQGDIARDPQGNIIWQNPSEDKTKPTDIARLMAERDALPPNSPARMIYDNAIKKQTTHAPAPSAQVIMPTQEKEQSKEYGKSMGELRGQINKAGFEGPSKLAQLQRMEQLLGGLDGGKLAPLGKDIASAAASFGIKLDGNLGNKEAAEALTREMASSLRKPGTGPMTDKDYDNFLLQVPGLSTTPEGRKQITMTLRGAIQRDMEAAKFARAYAKKNGGVIDDNFFDELADFYAKHPVITSTQTQPTINDIQAEIMRRQGKK